MIGLVLDSATTDVILKMKRFPLLFLSPFPLLRRNRPLLFFSRNFARNSYGIKRLLMISSYFGPQFSDSPCILPCLLGKSTLC